MTETSSKARKLLFRSLAVLLSLLASLAILELCAWLLLHKKYPRTQAIPTNEWVILTSHGRRLRPNLYIFSSKPA